MTRLTKEVLTVAYIGMVAEKFSDKTAVDALAEAEALCARLVLTEFVPESSETAGGGTAKNIELPPAQADALKVLWDLFNEDEKPVNAAALADTLDIDKDDAETRLEALVAADCATSSKRGRGTYYTPTAKLD